MPPDTGTANYGWPVYIATFAKYPPPPLKSPPQHVTVSWKASKGQVWTRHIAPAAPAFSVLGGGGGGRQSPSDGLPGGGGDCKGISRQNVVFSNNASKQNTGGRTSSANVGDWGRFGGLGVLHILSKGLVDLDLVTPLVVWGSVRGMCAFGVLKPC